MGLFADGRVEACSGWRMCSFGATIRLTELNAAFVRAKCHVWHLQMPHLDLADDISSRIFFLLVLVVEIV